MFHYSINHCVTSLILYLAVDKVNFSCHHEIESNFSFYQKIRARKCKTHKQTNRLDSRHKQRKFIRKTSLFIYGFWRKVENRSIDLFVPQLKIQMSNVKTSCVVMQIDFSCQRQMHDWGWISAYLKEGIVDL